MLLIKTYDPMSSMRFHYMENINIIKLFSILEFHMFIQVLGLTHTVNILEEHTLEVLMTATVRRNHIPQRLQ